MNMQTYNGILCFLAESTERPFEKCATTQDSAHTSTDHDLHHILWLDIAIGLSSFMLLCTVIVCQIRHTLAVQRKKDNNESLMVRQYVSTV